MRISIYACHVTFYFLFHSVSADVPHFGVYLSALLRFYTVLSYLQTAGSDVRVFGRSVVLS